MVDLKLKLKKLGKILKAFRKNTGYTQPELSSVSGVSTSIVNDLENGIRTAGCNTINKIAKGLGLNDEDRFRLLLLSHTMLSYLPILLWNKWMSSFSLITRLSTNFAKRNSVSIDFT